MGKSNKCYFVNITGFNVITLITILLLTASCLNKAGENQSDNRFEEWVQAELASGKQTIVFPKGVHHAYPQNVGAKVLHLSNNDDGLKNILFDLSNKENLVIDGNGSELIMHGHIIPFYLRNAKNITIKNLIIDWAHPFFAQGEITEVGEGFFTVRFDEEYPATVEEGRVVFLNPDLPENMSFNNINFYNRETGNIVIKSWDEYGVGADHRGEVIENNLIRIYSDKIISPLKPGYIAVFQYQGRSSPAIVSHRSSDIHLTNLTQFHAAATANLFEGSTNIYIDSLKMVSRPESGRWFTAHHDAMHFVECRGDIHIKDCKTEFVGDDDINIHGIYRPVVRKNGNNRLTVKLVHFQQMGVKTLFAGDEVGFHDAKTLAYQGKAKLSKVVEETAQETSLYFEEDLPELDWQNIVVTLREHNIDVQISGNHFSNHRARSLLIKTLGKVRIHDNYISVQGAAIQINNDVLDWFEAGPVEDVEIYNNVFDQCNLGGFSRATFEIFPSGIDVNSPVPIFKNVNIHNNKIIQIFKPLMFTSHAENLQFYDNEIVPGKDYELWYKGNTEPENIVTGAGLTKGQFQEIK